MKSIRLCWWPLAFLLMAGSLFATAQEETAQEETAQENQAGVPQGRVVTEEQIVQKDGLLYWVDTGTPFTGKIVTKNFPETSLFDRRVVTYREGKRDGPWTLWGKQGEKMGEGTFDNDKIVGSVTSWYSNGQKQAEGTYQDELDLVLLETGPEKVLECSLCKRIPGYYRQHQKPFVVLVEPST